MAYTRVNWQDLPSTTTPRNATNLNKMDIGIKTNDDKLEGNTPMGNIVVDSIKTKNLFDINGNVNVQGNSGNIVELNSVSNNILTCNVNGDQLHAVGQKFTNINGKTITFSAKILSTGTGSQAGIFIYDNGTLTSAQTYGGVNDTIYVTYTATSNNIVVAFATSGGTGAQYTDIQLEIGNERTNWAKYQNLDIPTNSLFANLNSAVYSDNLNNALIIGQYFYTVDTLNSPYTQIGTTDQYGLVLVLSNESNISTFRWVFQIALTTWGNIFMRTNINNGGWSSWLKVHYQ